MDCFIFQLHWTIDIRMTKSRLIEKSIITVPHVIIHPATFEFLLRVRNRAGYVIQALRRFGICYPDNPCHFRFNLATDSLRPLTGSTPRPGEPSVGTPRGGLPWTQYLRDRRLYRAETARDRSVGEGVLISCTVICLLVDKTSGSVRR